jgi:tetratricopeptide (TPR) repeat protein
MAAVLAAMLVASGLLQAPAHAQGRDLKFASAQAAYEQGLNAYKNGFYEIAIPALNAAAASLEPSKQLFAEYFLAQIYADNTGSHTDHTKAYTYFKKIVDVHADIDPDDRLRAPYVARSLTAVAGYSRRGIPDFGLVANISLALDFYNQAATWFDEPDAQFELAKMYIIGDGVQKDVKVALHYLRKLVNESHAPAQAFLADLQWQGRVVPREPEKALALIRMAMENAPRTDRLWIEDIYHKIYCGTSADVRSNSDGLVMRWKQIFARPRYEDRQVGVALADIRPSRVCRNGEPLQEIESGAKSNLISNFTVQQPTRPAGTTPQR